MRFIFINCLLLFLTACSGTHDGSESAWESRVARYSVGDDANDLTDELQRAGYPVRFNPTLPPPEMEARYVLPSGDLHIVTTTDEHGRLVFAAEPYFAPSSDSVAERLAHYDQQWNEYVKSRTRGSESNP